MRGADRLFDVAASPLVGRVDDRTHHDNRAHGAGLTSWVYEYGNTVPLSKEWVGCGIEIAVQIRGEWSHEGWLSGRRRYGAESIVRSVAGERYCNERRADGEAGAQVGFSLSGSDLATVEGTDGALWFKPESGLVDPAFRDFCRSFHADTRRGEPPADAEVRAAVLGYVRRHGELRPATPLVRAKKELERHFDCDLAMTHLAGNAGLHPERFARQFRETFGITPARYRLLLRLNHAARLCWSRLDLPIAAVAEQCGFRNRAYFHRLFVAAHRVTPLGARRRFELSRARAAPR